MLEMQGDVDLILCEAHRLPNIANFNNLSV